MQTCADWRPLGVQGKLQAASLAFDEAVQHVSFRTRIGGEATLQKAICLDSLVRHSSTCLALCKSAREGMRPSKGVRNERAMMQGRNEEAMPLYKLISRHSAPHVARSAKRLLFGFTAGDYLKAHTITYVSLVCHLTEALMGLVVTPTGCMCLK